MPKPHLRIDESPVDGGVRAVLADYGVVEPRELFTLANYGAVPSRGDVVRREKELFQVDYVSHVVRSDSSLVTLVHVRRLL